MTDLATAEKEDYNDEKERLEALANIIYTQVQIFPKVLSKLIASYVILFNITFPHPGIGKCLSLQSLSCTIPIWTIEVKDDAYWSAGLYNVEQKIELELYSSDISYMSSYTHAITGIETESFCLPPFNIPGSRLTFIADLTESCIYACVNGDKAVKIWSNIHNLSEFYPFYRFLDPTEFRIVPNPLIVFRFQ